MHRLRMGMVGGGKGAFIGGVHRMAAALDGQIELAAGCFSRDYENTRATGKQLNLDPARCYRTYQEMARAEASLPEDRRIDFVSVVTPNRSHFPIAREFLEAGFHVVCDKPMTYTLAEAEELVRLVEQTGLVFVLTHNYTGYPMIRHARELFRTGKMGKVRKVIVEYLQDFLAYPHEKEGMKQAVWRTDPEQAGVGGTLGDVGTHALNLLEYVTGDAVTRLCADKSTFLPDRALDEDANVLLRMQGGGKGVLTVSQVATGEENALRLRVYASEGAVRWDQENPNYLELLRYGEPGRTLTRGSGYLSPAAAEVTRIPVGHPEGFLEGFANIYRDAAEAIRLHRGGRAMKIEDYPVPTVYDGLRGMQFIHRAVESSDRGSVWVDF
ncbi:MAG: Gfo/Idh/MocA family protein [Spirochaetota bacterium]